MPIQFQLKGVFMESKSSSCCTPKEEKSAHTKSDSCETSAAATPIAISEVSREDVKEFYGKAGDKPQANLCCPTIYNKEDIAHIPVDVMEVSYGCGSPVTLSELKPGEIHVDLGSGGGVDCFIASKYVGKTGRVVGIDMTPEMMTRATQNARAIGKKLGYHNIEFKHGFLEDVPVDDQTADLLTSNCVVNLSPDKKKVMNEVKRVLKDGGRFVISDIVSEVPVPKNMQKNKELWGECISGALTEKEFVDFSKEAGFYGLEILKRTFFRKVEGFNFWSVTLRGWKRKKDETCNYTGQYATYLGPFSQVQDDEDHTYVRNVPVEVCTDTAIKLTNAPYNKNFIVTGKSKDENDTSCCSPSDANSSKSSSKKDDACSPSSNNASCC